MKQIIRLICLAVMACAAINASAWEIPEEMPATTFSGGSGTQTDPYRISTAQDLVNFSYICKNASTSATRGKYYVLTNDITLNNVSKKEDLRSPSCQSLAIKNLKGPFAGNFDGRGHTITGLVFETSRYGFFGDLEDAKISNVTFNFVGLAAPYYVESAKLFILAGDVENTVFSNVHINNAYCFYNYRESTRSPILLGGMVYYTEGSVVFSDCSMDLDIHEKCEVVCVGGFLYKNDGDLYINRCRVDGLWNSTFHSYATFPDYYIGGFLALNYKGSATINQSVSAIELNYNNCKYDHEDASFGGFVGQQHSKADRLSIGESAFLGKLNFKLYDDPEKSGDASLEDCRIGGFIGYCNEEAELYNLAVIGEINFENTVENDEEHYLGFIIGDVNDDVTYHRCSIVSFDSHFKSVSSYDNGIDPVAHYDDEEEMSFDLSNYVFYYVKCNGEQVTKSWLKNASNKGESLFNESWILQYLNTYSTRTVWGRYNNSESAYNGAPLQIACGGVLGARQGTGTADNPFLIETEADLRALSSESYNADLYGKYYKLNADIVMSNKPFPAIGRNTDCPFRGNFNGNGHSITGMVAANGSMFAYMCGTVQGLALLDFSAAEVCTDVAPIAMTLGWNVPGGSAGELYTGTVTNCYASGDLWAFTVPSIYDTSTQSYCSGLCGTIYNGSSLTNSYFIGSLNTYVKEGSPSPTVHQNAICNYNHGTVDHCYAILSFSTLGDKPDFYRPGINYSTNSETGTFTNNWYIAVGDTKGYDESMRLETYKDLRKKFTEYPFGRVCYLNPVNVQTKCYLGSGADDNPLSYIDATRPLFYDYFNTVYYVDKQNSDARTWELPNVAIADPDTKTATVSNYIIDPSKNHFFWRGYSDNFPMDILTFKKVGNVTFPLTLNDTGWYSLCLPCDLYLKDLPEGSKIRAVGGVTAENTVRLIEVMYVPAGAPCVVYIPTENTGTYTLNLSGTLAVDPQKISEYSSMVGAFKAATVSKVAVLALDDKGNPYFQYQASADIKPYTGYIADATADITITDVTGAFLDQSYIANSYTIEQYDRKVAPAIALIAEYPAGKWSAICLPFDLTVAQARELFGEDYALEEFKFAHYNESTDDITMFFGRVDMVNIQCPLAAGKPYLIKPSKEFDSSQPLTGYTLSISTTTTEDYIESSEYGKMTVRIEPTFDYFTDKWYFVYDSENDVMTRKGSYNGLSFYVPVESEKSLYTTTINLYHDVTSGVESPADSDTAVEVVGIYDLSGRRLAAPQPGVNILLMSDGSARKILRQE